MKAVHFGAGNIGRGFIGLLLSKAGYEVCFVDVNEEMVAELQRRRSYTVTLANDAREKTRVEGVTAIHGNQLEQVAAAVAEADIVTTAVGVGALKYLAPALAEGIKLRVAQGTVAAPLHVLACENTIGGSSQLKELVYGLLDDSVTSKLKELVAFPDTAVDRIVPLQQNEDPLEVVVEPFFEWVIDESALLAGATKIEGAHYVRNLEPYIERKLFTVNTGHCVAAYHGFLAGCETIQQAMADENVRSKVLGTLTETGNALVSAHGFDGDKHRHYIETILGRFANPHLTDEVSRVGRSPIRKLSPQDRLVRPAKLAHELGLATDYLAAGMAAALCFREAGDPESVAVQETIEQQGVSAALTQYTGLPSDHAIHQQALAQYEKLRRL